MNIRPGTPADAPHLAQTEQAAAAFPWSLSQIIQSCRNERQRVLVLDLEELPCAGFAVIDCIVDEATLLNIAVHPDCQGRGFGTALLQAVVECSASMGALKLMLEVRSSNLVALSLYRRFGFREDGIRKKYYPAASGREDAVLMSRAIGSET